MKIKVGILGGAFDPIHLGHLHLARLAIKKFEFEKFVFIPSFTHPFKGSKSYYFQFEERVDLLQNAIKEFFSKAEQDIIEISAIEKDLPGENFTYNTIKTLLNKNPNWIIHFIIGSDNLLHLKEWYKVNDLLKICRLSSFQRSGYDPQVISASLENQFEKKDINDLLSGIFEANLPNVSSSLIREKFLKKEYDLNELLPSTIDAVKKIMASKN